MEVLGIIDIPLWLILLCLGCLLLYTYGRHPFSVWSDLGIPGPKPRLFTGNAVLIGRVGFMEAFSQWKQQYGPVVGVYHMKRPMLLVNDINMLKKILVSEFNDFSYRGIILPKGFRSKLADGNVGVVEGEVWKRIRTLLNPLFTPAKLKQKNDLIWRAADKAVTKMLQIAKNQEELKAKEFYTTLMLELILTSLFSTDLITNDETIRQFHAMFQDFAKQTPLMVRMYQIAGVFPFLSYILGKLSDPTGPAVKQFSDFVTRELNKRTESSTHVDFLQNMINAECHEKDRGPGRTKLTKDEIICQAFIFFAASTEVTSSLFTMLTYILATQHDIQDKMVEEIRSEIGNEEVSYDNVHQLKYMYACVQETLRMHPPTEMLTRQCVHETTINGYTIPAGAGIFVPVKNITNDPAYYTDPDVFNPNRFLKGHPEEVTDVPFMSFGIGPRHCIGMRLAMFAITLTMALTLKKIRFVGSSTYTTDKHSLAAIARLSDPIRLQIEAR